MLCLRSTTDEGSIEYGTWLGEYSRSRALLKALAPFLPVVGAVIAIGMFGQERTDLLLYFNRVTDNRFVITDLLFIGIFASYATIIIGLLVYLWDVTGDLADHRGRDLLVKFLGRSTLLIVCLVGAALVGYLVAILLACTGVDLSRDGLATQQFIELDRYLSVGVFAFFCLADFLSLCSQERQFRENTSQLTKLEAVEGDEDEVREIKNNIEKNQALGRLSFQSIWLVNLPTVIVNIGMIVLAVYLERADRFHWEVQGDLHFFPIHRMWDTDYYLFVNGMDVGIITAVILFSQIVYAVLKYKYEIAQICVARR